MKKQVVVIGGGPAGMMAAIEAAKSSQVILLEQGEKLGKKLYITGKGRCNVTNDCPPREFLESVINGQKFCTSAIYNFPPQSTIEFLSEHGTKTKTERGCRVFPISDKASDITKAFQTALNKSKVDIRLNTKVTAITVSEGHATGVKTQNETISAHKVIVATGGFSYPATGSTGDGYRFAKTLGLAVTPPMPALTGLETDKTHLAALQGLSLKNVSVSIVEGGKKIASEFGEMVFTHYGISGPCVLSLSSRINRMNLSTLTAVIDLKPALDEKQLDARILRDFELCSNKQFKNSLDELLPKSLISVIILASGIDPDKKIHQISSAERKSLVKTLKNFTLKISGLRGFDEAIVTSGGVALSQIDPKTMAARGVEGLHFAGEVLDIDAETGGYNIQLALSTGYLAGRDER